MHVRYFTVLFAWEGNFVALTLSPLTAEKNSKSSKRNLKVYSNATSTTGFCFYLLVCINAMETPWKAFG